MFSSQTMEQNKHNGTRQLKKNGAKRCTTEKTDHIHENKTGRINLQQIVYEVSDRMNRRRERPEQTVGNLGTEHFTCARGSAFVNKSGEPVNGWVSISTDRNVPRVRGT